MTRDELEARLWHHMPRAHSSVIVSILADVDAYVLAEIPRGTARRRLLAALDEDTPSEIPLHLRQAHATAKRHRVTGQEVPGPMRALESEYWRTVKRRQRRRVA